MNRLICLFLACLLSFHLGHAQGKSVVKYQYWIDSVTLNSANDGIVNASDVTFSVDTKDLKPGLHNLLYRIQDSEGNWSSMQSWLFYVNKLKKNSETKVMTGEYWIDENDRQSIDIKDNVMSFVLDATDVKQGMHTLNYYVTDNEGMKSPLQTWIFIRNATRDTSIVNQTECMEYWFDDKSNVKQTYMSFSDTLDFQVDATPLGSGFHTLGYRVKDILGNYSQAHIWAFYKSDQVSTRISWYKYWWNNNTDKAVVENIESDTAVFVFSKELEIPRYAMTDGYSDKSTARFNILFGDDMGGVSNVEWVDVSYPDVIPPESVIEADKEQANESVNLSWYVKNDQIEDYNVYYSENDRPFVLWLPNTTKTTASFKGQSGSSYRFTVTARDKDGNREKLDENKVVKVIFK